MKIEEQIPRNALVWIILTQFALLLPHMQRIPGWVLAVYVATALWRFMVYQGRWSLPGKWVKVLVTLSVFTGIYYSYRSLIGLEPTVALLLTAFALKLIELVARRDAYMLLFLSYFVCVTEFLFSQELHITLYMFVPVLLATTSLVALHEPFREGFNFLPLRRASAMLAQSFPLMLVLFLIFPRIGPLWSVPLKAHTAKSGMSDFISPGDVSQLSLSDEVAFRVQFSGEVPPRNMLYWRGLVFSRLEDGAWSSFGWRDTPAAQRRRQEPPQPQGPVTAYNVIMEPTQQHWLYGLRYPDSSDRRVMKSNDFRLFSPNPVEDQRSYSARSWMEQPLELDLSLWRRSVETRLPADGNPRTRALARQLHRAAAGDDWTYVLSVLDMYRHDEFYYTLRPPLLGDEPMDDFLFNSRRGFCEHYAASFTYMMRAAGVPARVVAGYQGGEVNPVNGTVIVHQFDAHAWSEVWIQGNGWVRVDPTATIAPDRIDWGLERALQDEGSFLEDSPFSPLRYRNVAWLNRLRLRVDALNYSWQRFVLQYDSDEQFRLLDGLLGEVSASRLAGFLIGGWMLILIPVAFSLLRPTGGPRLDAASTLYLEFCHKLAKVGLPRQIAEAPASYAQRIGGQRPELAVDVNAIAAVYDALSYRSVSDEQALKLLRRQVRSFNPSSQ